MKFVSYYSKFSNSRYFTLSIILFILLNIATSSALKFSDIKSSISFLVLESFMSFTWVLNSANRAIIVITSSLFKIYFVYILLVLKITVLKCFYPINGYLLRMSRHFHPMRWHIWLCKLLMIFICSLNT